MLSKSLIQFSVDGWGCVPSLLFDMRPNYDGGNEDNSDLLQKVPHMHCRTQCPQPAADVNPRLHQRLLDTHGQVCVRLLWDHCSFLSGPGVHKVLFVPSQSLFPQSCLSSGSSVTQVYCTQSTCLCSRPLLTHTSAGDAPTLFWLSLCGSLGPGALKVCLSPLSIFVGKGFDSKHDFTLPTIFLGLLLCPRMWGIFFWWDPTFSSWQLLSSEL